ncbi:MAG: hypothetical protein R3F02_18835 [Thiolinea sp.]
MSIQPYDEDRIKPEDLIIRRVNPNYHIVWDENRQCNRISSKLISPSSTGSKGMSVDIEALIVAADIDPKHFVTTPVYTGSVAFPARVVRDLGLMVGYEPIPGNPYHGEVWSSPCGKFSRRQKKGLCSSSKWYVKLAGVDLF